MVRLIDADKLIENHLSANHRIAMSEANKCWIRKIINEEPTVDAEPVRHGKWNPAAEDWRNQIVWWQCSKCGYDVSTKYPYCPQCGARMDLK